LAAYQRGLALGGSRPLPELFAAAGCRFDFTRETVQPLVELVQSELANMGE
jgi:oligoendopeptidase F